MLLLHVPIIHKRNIFLTTKVFERCTWIASLFTHILFDLPFNYTWKYSVFIWQDSLSVCLSHIFYNFQSIDVLPEFISFKVFSISSRISSLVAPEQLLADTFLGFKNACISLFMILFQKDININNINSFMKTIMTITVTVGYTGTTISLQVLLKIYFNKISTIQTFSGMRLLKICLLVVGSRKSLNWMAWK